MKLNFKIDANEVANFRDSLQNAVKKARLKATDATGSQIKKDLVKAVLNELKLEPSLVNYVVVMKQTSAGVLVEIDSDKLKKIGILNKNHAIPIDKFSLRRSRAGVTTRIKREKLVKSAFIATMPRTGKKGVFVRKFSGGKRVGRLPIKQIKFTSSLEMVASDHLEKIIAESKETLLKVFKAELEKNMNK